MKIFSAAQIKNWDAASIREQGIESDALMENAAAACYHWLLNHHLTVQPISVFCGKGNNGGDGLALARMLLQNNVQVTVYILELGKPGSTDFQKNLHRLHQVTTNIHFIQSENFFPDISGEELIIDALFGTGLNKPPEGIAAALIEHMNNSRNPVISIDIPSGIFCDKSSRANAAIKAAHTLSFQAIKLAFLMPENDKFVGTFHILPIGLSKKYEMEEPAVHEILDPAIIKAILRPRNKFSHKGNFGHAALVAGSYGMMGACVLASRACMHAGAGKLTCYIPSCGYTIIQSTVPEAMCHVEGEKYITGSKDIQKHDSIAVGPGVGIQKETGALLLDIFRSGHKKIVLDADALNAMAYDKKLLPHIPEGVVITPHPKEFNNLFGPSTNDFERLETAVSKAAEYGIYIVLKGHYTAIITPLGKVYFNATGNAGMAKAGMGDVLTGIILGLMARGYPLPEAAMLGVHLHGSAGDIAAARHTQESMQASNLVDCMPDAWKLFGA